MIELFDDIAPVAAMAFRNRCSGANLQVAALHERQPIGAALSLAAADWRSSMPQQHSSICQPLWADGRLLLKLACRLHLSCLAAHPANAFPPCRLRCLQRAPATHSKAQPSTSWFGTWARLEGRQPGVRGRATWAGSRVVQSAAEVPWPRLHLLPLCCLFLTACALTLDHSPRRRLLTLALSARFTPNREPICLQHAPGAARACT